MDDENTRTQDQIVTPIEGSPESEKSLKNGDRKPVEPRHVTLQVETDGNSDTVSVASYLVEDTHLDDDHELAKPKVVAETTYHKAQIRVKTIVEHLAFRILTILLIITEFVIVVIDISINDDGHIHHLDLVSKIIMGYFLLELAARMFYMGASFFHSWVEILDMVIVVLTFIIDLAFSQYARLGIVGRSVRVLRIVRGLYLMFHQRKQLASATRRIVSQNKRRYVKDGFDLDLCYITERVIAMSFPSSGIHTMYRNNISEVAEFFNTKHTDHYMLYNLCSEREYNVDFFNKCVERVFIDDHNVPTLKEMVDFCDSVHSWMSQDPENIVAIHCKGGKGRTGTMICIWLVECGIFEEAQESLNYFGDRRTDLDVGKTFQGVETPSQSRFVGYFGQVKKELEGNLPRPRPVRIKSVKITSIKGVGYSDGTDLSMEVWSKRELVYKVKFKKGENCTLTHNVDENYIEVKFENCPVLVNDIKVRFLSKSTNIPSVYDNCAFYFWCHTAFVEERMFLTRDEIDNPHKKRAQKMFKENFSIEMFFTPVRKEKMGSTTKTVEI